MSAPWLIIGWPNVAGCRKITDRRDGTVVGYIRSTTDPVRYFAEDKDGFPIEGTFVTRAAAVNALLREVKAS